MALPLWIGFQASQNLKCWFCNEEQDWVQLGEILSVECLSFPLVFSVPKTFLDATWQRVKNSRWEQNFDRITNLTFVLKRDDSTLYPVHEIGSPSTKLMSVFHEFCDSLTQLAQAIGLAVVGFESVEQPGAFKLQVRFSTFSNIGEVFRIFGLLRAGLEIISFTRGFQMSDLRWEDTPVDESLLQRLEQKLCD